MALFLASALAALLIPAAPSRAQDGRELLRPLRVDLRRLSLPFAENERGFLPAEGFLAGPDSPRLGPPPRAPRTALPVSRRRSESRRPDEWTIRGGAKGDYTVILSFDPSGLAYPVSVQ